jgi:uncharacterized membrane protein YdcZ (DUF606 family)
MNAGLRHQIARLVAAAGAAAFSGLLVLLAYVIVDLYLSGHNLARRSPSDGNPWYQSVAGFLVIVVPIVVGMRVYRQSRGR